MVVEEQYDDLQQVARAVRSQPQLPDWSVVVIEWVGDERPLRGVEAVFVSHAVLAG